MATAYHLAVAPARHKRKGIPMRSPCRRDMLESPGVVFRFPDKISALGSTIPATASTPELNQSIIDATDASTAVVPGLNILPSSAGLPSGLGAKTAAAVIAAAAAVSATGSVTAITTTTAGTTTDADAATTPAAAATAATTTTAETSNTAGESKSDLAVSSVSSTPVLKPSSAVPIHRSASNVLHYPELLSDLRDRLIQVHQNSHLNNHSSSGVDSDGNGATGRSTADGPSSAKRARTKRTGRGPAAGADSGTASSHHHSGTRRSGLRGGSGPNASSSSPGPGPTTNSSKGNAATSMRTSARSRSELSAAAAAAAVRELESMPMATAAAVAAFHRRHSIGTIRSRMDEEDEEVGDEMEEEEELVDIDDEDDDASTTSSIHPAAAASSAVSGSQYHRQTGSAKHPGDGSTASKNRVPASHKRKREKDTLSNSDRRSGSPLVKRADSSNNSGGGVYSGGGRRSCASCAAISTPCWRPGWIDSMTLCNSCGLRYKKGKVFCAACCYVPMKTEIATGGAIVCKRCSSSIQSSAERTPSSTALAHQLHRLQ
ncbi:hypothetical protein GQ54DRAFT_172165 [Martensiomyces pterosporus]|nr:hypothetical protein GQ54DRAFT_172165 [Martensiomyces pterosporus]